MVLSLATSIYLLAGGLAWFHLTQGRRRNECASDGRQRYRLPNASASSAHSLVEGIPFEGGRTWQCFLRKRSRSDIERLVTDRRVEDTFHIAPHSALNWIVPNLPRARGWLESDRLGQSVWRSRLSRH